MSRSNDHEQRQRLKPTLQLLEARQFDAALPLLKQFCDEYPDNEVAIGMLASTYFELGLTDSATSLYQEILRKNPQNVLARFQLGMAIFQQRNWARAFIVWEPLAEDEEDFAANFYCGMAQLNLGDKEKAINYFRVSARRMPSGHPLLASLEKIAGELNISLAS